MRLSILTLTPLKLECLVSWSRTETGGECVFFCCEFNPPVPPKKRTFHHNNPILKCCTYISKQIRQTRRPESHKSRHQNVLTPTDGGQRDQDRAATGHSSAPGLYWRLQQHCSQPVWLSSCRSETEEKNCTYGEEIYNRSTKRRTLVWMIGFRRVI